MAGRIPQQFIDDLMSRVDIVDVVDERVPLKKQGKDYMACCPFHDENTPSFSVSPEKQFYYCFGCGAHGTAIGFLMDYAHMEFPEAVEHLAERVGLEVPHAADAAGEGDPERRALYEVLERANHYYRRQLREHPAAQRAVDYLKSRGLSGEIAAAFQIGFAPPGWDNLLHALGAGESERRLLARAGLLIERGPGRVYDRFRDRITFPIHDRRGRVVGFGGRIIDEGEPKYLNSPETPIFHKGRELYGLYQAQRANRRLEQLLVVEGYMDVVALAQFGLRYAVASLGTSATGGQLEQLFRAAPRVVFCFDGDSAGRRAAWRSLETALPLLREGREVRFMFLPEGEDPDSAVRRHGREAFEGWVEGARPLVEFLFEHLLAEVDAATVEGRARLAELARPLLGRLPAGPLKSLAIRELCQRTGLEREELTTLQGDTQLPQARRRRGEPRASSGRRRSSPSLVRRVITLLLHRPALGALGGDTERLRALDLPGVPLLVELLELASANPGLTTGAILERFRPREAGRHLEKLAAEDPPVLTEGLEREFRDALARLERLCDEQRLERLTHKAREAALTEEEKEEYRRLLAARSKPEREAGFTVKDGDHLL